MPDVILKLDDRQVETLAQAVHSGLREGLERAGATVAGAILQSVKGTRSGPHGASKTLTDGVLIGFNSLVSEVKRAIRAQQQHQDGW